MPIPRQIYFARSKFHWRWSPNWLVIFFPMIISYFFIHLTCSSNWNIDVLSICKEGKKKLAESKEKWKMYTSGQEIIVSCHKVGALLKLEIKWSKNLVKTWPFTQKYKITQKYKRSTHEFTAPKSLYTFSFLLSFSFSPFFYSSNF